MPHRIGTLQEPKIFIRFFSVAAMCRFGGVGFSVGNNGGGGGGGVHSPLFVVSVNLAWHVWGFVACNSYYIKLVSLVVFSCCYYYYYYLYYFCYFSLLYNPKEHCLTMPRYQDNGFDTNWCFLCSEFILTNVDLNWIEPLAITQLTSKIYWIDNKKFYEWGYSKEKDVHTFLGNLRRLLGISHPPDILLPKFWARSISFFCQSLSIFSIFHGSSLTVDTHITSKRYALNRKYAYVNCIAVDEKSVDTMIDLMVSYSSRFTYIYLSTYAYTYNICLFPSQVRLGWAPKRAGGSHLDCQVQFFVKLDKNSCIWILILDKTPITNLYLISISAIPALIWRNIREESFEMVHAVAQLLVSDQRLPNSPKTHPYSMESQEASEAPTLFL